MDQICIGRATYDASQEIRSGDLTREEGMALVKKYDGEFPERWAKEIFDYLSLPTSEFPIASRAFEQAEFDHEYYERLCDKVRSPHLWHWNDSEGWSLRHHVWQEDGLQQEATAASWQGNTAK